MKQIHIGVTLKSILLRYRNYHPQKFLTGKNSSSMYHWKNACHKGIPSWPQVPQLLCLIVKNLNFIDVNMTKIHSKGNDGCLFIKCCLMYYCISKTHPSSNQWNNNSKNLLQRKTKTNKSFTFVKSTLILKARGTLILKA